MTAPTQVQPHKPLEVALREIQVFSDLSEGQMAWLVAHMSDETFPAGARVLNEDGAAEHLSAILEGELRIQSSNPEMPVTITRAGTVTGVLPYSRLRTYPGNVYATQPLRMARLHRDLFEEMLLAIPVLGARLTAVMADRIRSTARLSQQREKLTALGKLAAGLAHELNNPTSAAQRAAHDLRRWVERLRTANEGLERAELSAAQRACLAELERGWLGRLRLEAGLDSIERSDREESMAAWLKSQQVADGWEYASAFVEAGLTRSEIEEAASLFGGEARNDGFARLAATLQIEKLLGEIDGSTSRMTDLVRAVKEYSFLDQAPVQEVDIQRGLENTLTMLANRLKRGVTVVREFDHALPRVPAHGGELNQVWTNIINNALDAMEDKGTLRVRTSSEIDMALVEITDTGPGIPVEIQDRIFDPFFTTKEVGAGTGLGLDMAFRIVEKHRGDIRFTSRPGETKFQVRLPFAGPAEVLQA